MTAKILIIDDDRLLVNSIKKNLEFDGYDVIFRLSGDDITGVIECESPDLVLLDISLGELSGLDILKEIKSKNSDLPVIMITGNTDVNSVVTSMKAGAFDFIGKPLDIGQLGLVINKALNHLQINQELEVLREEVVSKSLPHNIVCASAKTNKVIDLARKVSAGNDISVLIQGETGTGKEVIAHLIHKQSRRNKGPFIAINCASLPRELIEGELFGSEKGAFTGALNRLKKGKFELADNGTILLDEISETDLVTQAKLLRVLQEKAFYRVGGEREIRVNIRIIATTNRKIEEEVKNGKFRQDLYYRLNVAKIELPPLRERKEDIIPLAMNFINECNKKLNKDFSRVSPEAESLLLSYPWPGNVRELKNLVEQIVLIEDGNVILPEYLSRLKASATIMGGNTGGLQMVIPAEGCSLDLIVRKAVEDALEKAENNQTLAAKLLGITRRQLTYKMKQFEIDS